MVRLRCFPSYQLFVIVQLSNNLLRCVQFSAYTLDGRLLHGHGDWDSTLPLLASNPSILTTQPYFIVFIVIISAKMKLGVGPRRGINTPDSTFQTNVKCFASKSQTPNMSTTQTSDIDKKLKLAELACIATAGGVHLAALTHLRPTPSVAIPPKGSRNATLYPSHTTGIATINHLWLSAPLLLALLFNKLQSLLFENRRQKTFKIADAAAARLIRLESIVQAQSQRLEDQSRQLEKMRIRVKLTSKDGKTMVVREIAEKAAVQADALVGLADRIQGVEDGVNESRDLIAALQGVSAKQFGLIAKLVASQGEAYKKMTSQHAAAPLEKAAVSSSNSSSSSIERPSSSSTTKPLLSSISGVAVGKDGKDGSLIYTFSDK